jgi:dolichyl-phosphate beta-glucosyltransferase
VLSLDFKDTQCGFKAFRQNAGRSVFSQQQIERWGFDAEILFLARQAGLKVVEVPVRWAHDRRTKIHPIVDGLRMVGEILSIRWHSLCGTYGAKNGQTHGESGDVHTVIQSPKATPLASESQLGD